MTGDAAENAGRESSAPALPGIAARGCERCGNWEAQEMGGHFGFQSFFTCASKSSCFNHSNFLPGFR
ncbi:MAG TPA: hypothetical protein VNX46_02920 [Candidatus Acidoferrum sp.]|jgi:hypothetical protein|nr:hypothetical protein [Candidatus Acidoferrum sp.]